MARPRNPFDLRDEKYEEQFIGLCELQCTRKEICGFFRISKDTLNARIREAYGEEHTFQTVFEEFSAGGRISLRRNQFRLAQKSAAMAIFLGKNYLDQVDVKTVDDINKPITLTWTDAKKPSNSKVTVKVDQNANSDKTQ